MSFLSFTISGIFVHDFDSRQTYKLTEIGGGFQWLSDSRRLLFNGQGKLHLIDSQSKKIHEVPTGSSAAIAGFSLSQDNSMIVYLVRATEADIWLAELE